METVCTSKDTYSFTVDSMCTLARTDCRFPPRHGSHQHDVYLALGVLPQGVIRFVVFPVVVELNNVCVALCRVLFRNFIHVFVLFARGEGHGKQSGRQATWWVIAITLLQGGQNDQILGSRERWYACSCPVILPCSQDASKMQHGPHHSSPPIGYPCSQPPNRREFRSHC